MESLRTQQDVNATADVVWSVLQDGAQYCRWVPGVEHVDGGIQDGQSITLLGPEGQDSTRMQVTTATNRRSMTWRTGPGWGLDASEITFELAETEFGCTVVLDRRDSGLLHGLLGDDEEDPKARLDELARNLAQAAETRGAHEEVRQSPDGDPGEGTGMGISGADVEPDPGPGVPGPDRGTA
ncbi:MULTISPECIES: SRPBCC family protein [unclassified Arthrobacter]|uniref:SRPBCC family protein n=1 Tax=unclassified Arthrobacter TaxID=235627 RepID=UPI002656DDF4|nr:SRPBCC family protein [Micrococcaceae bacterium]MDN5885449.1 SRPBCC family protein [Micrococcaceae bacterium]